MPAPPSSSGKITPSNPISPSFFTTSCGNSLFSSHSLTCGAISPSANARTELCNCLCSSVNPNISLSNVIIAAYTCITSKHTLAHTPAIIADQREARKKSPKQDRKPRHEVAAPREVGPSGRTESLNPIQRLPQIPHNILDILNPHRHPH